MYTLFPYTSLFRSLDDRNDGEHLVAGGLLLDAGAPAGRLLRIAHHVRRHAVEARDLAVAVLHLFQELELVRRERDGLVGGAGREDAHARSEEHTSELQSLMRISYAVFCLKKK